MGILVLLSVLSRSPATSSYFIHMRKLEPRETIDLPKVTQEESSKVRTGKASKAEPLLLPVEMGRLPQGPGFTVTSNSLALLPPLGPGVYSRNNSSAVLLGKRRD